MNLHNLVQLAPEETAYRQIGQTAEVDTDQLTEGIQMEDKQCWAVVGVSRDRLMVVFDSDQTSS